MRFVLHTSLMLLLCLVFSGGISHSCSSITLVSSPGIEFIDQDWEQARAKSRTENKLMFIDIYATWCGPCRQLERITFADEKVGEFFNTNFINIEIDGEKGVGQRLAKQYGIQGYPTLIIADSAGKPLLYTMGYINAEELLKFGAEALKRK